MGTKKEKRSRSFRATRKHHGTEAAEDYTELVADLIHSSGEARTCEIAEHLGISHVTALRTMRRLKLQGYLQTGPRQPVKLTRKGKQLASYSKKRHQLLVKFLVAIGVPREQAEVDIEGAEHHFSPITVRCVKRVLPKLS